MKKHILLYRYCLPLALSSIEAKRQPWSVEAFTNVIKQQYSNRHNHKLDYLRQNYHEDENDDIIANKEDVIAVREPMEENAQIDGDKSSNYIWEKLYQYKSRWSQKFLCAMENIELEMRHAIGMDKIQDEVTDEQWHDRMITKVYSSFKKSEEVTSRGDSCSSFDQLVANKSRIKRAPMEGILTPEEREKLVLTMVDLLHAVENALADHDLWEVVVDDEEASIAGHEVKIWKTHFDVIDNNHKRRITQEPTVRSETIMDANPKDVFCLFKDNRRVHEYNDNCSELHDVELINENTKINWCATSKMGPFKPRDFVTLVHYCDHKDGFASVAAHVDHHRLPPAEGYVRAQIQINATFMHPVQDQLNKTRFIQITRIGELGRILETPVARKVSQQIQVKAPIDFSKKFNDALKRSDPLPNKNKLRNPPFEGIGIFSHET